MRAIATTTQQNPGAIGIAHGAEGTLDNAVFIEFIGLLQVRALALFDLLLPQRRASFVAS
jgi:hypothetical protein